MDLFWNWSTWGLVPWPGIEPRPHTTGEWNLSHWTTREVPGQQFILLSRCDAVLDLYRMGAVQNPYQLVCVLLRLQLPWVELWDECPGGPAGTGGGSLGWLQGHQRACACSHGCDLLWWKDAKKSQPRGKHTEWNPWEIRHQLQGPLPGESRRRGSTPPALSCDNAWETSPVGRMFFLGAAHKVSPLPGTDQHSRLLEGKQVFGINYVCTHSLSTLIT